MTKPHSAAAIDHTARAIAFGFVATFTSSFGQTFFLGLFSTQFGAAAGIGGTVVSLLYGIATLASGTLLFWLGGAMDRLALRSAVVVTVLLLLGGCLLVAGLENAVMLLAAFFVLRLGGQGLLAQLAVVAAARNGGPRKGSAIAWAMMGVIAGEAILPASVVAILGVLYWRELWLGVAALVLLLVLPGLGYLQRPLRWRAPAPRSIGVSADDPNAEIALERRDLLCDARFWTGAAIMLIPPFMSTGFLFEISTVARAMGWSAGSIGAAFTVFAVCRAFGTWFCGRTADRIGAIRMARWHLVPMALAFVSLALPSGAASIWLPFAGIGLSAGANSVLSGALWVDIYGTAAVGMVRGVFGAAGVLASALAPVILAVAFSMGASAGGVGLVFGGYALVVPLIAGAYLMSGAKA